MIRPCRALLFVLLFAACGCGGQHLPNFHVVDDGILLRGGQPDAVGLATLRDRYGVGTVVNLNDKTTNDELVATVALGMDYLPLPIKTSDLPPEKLLVFLRTVEDARDAGRGPVFVHCQFGQDRTGAAVGVYRVLENGWTAERATAEKNEYQQWFHRLFLPQVSRRIRQAGRRRDEWREAVGKLPPPPLVRPRAATRPAATTRRAA